MKRKPTLPDRTIHAPELGGYRLYTLATLSQRTGLPVQRLNLAIQEGLIPGLEVRLVAGRAVIGIPANSTVEEWLTTMAIGVLPAAPPDLPALDRWLEASRLFLKAAQRAKEERERPHRISPDYVK